MKVAVIGCGTIANTAHIPAYIKNPEAEIAYFCDIIPERAEKSLFADEAAQVLHLRFVGRDDAEVDALIEQPFAAYPFHVLLQKTDEQGRLLAVDAAQAVGGALLLEAAGGGVEPMPRWRTSGAERSAPW